MNQSIVMRLLAAACATAVVSSLPAQSAPAVRSGARAVAPEVAQDPAAPPKRAEAGDKVQLRLAEVMAMLEEDDMTPEQQQKALKKLAEVADRLKQDRAAAPTRSVGGMVARAASPAAPADAAQGSAGFGASAGPGQSSGGGVARVRSSGPASGGFGVATAPETIDKPAQVEVIGVPMPHKPAKAPKAPKAPKPPKDAPEPAAPAHPAAPADPFRGHAGHDQAAHEVALKAHGEALRAHAEALRAHESAAKAAKADEMQAHAEAMKQHAEAFRKANRVFVAKALDEAGKTEVVTQRWLERAKGVPADDVKVLLERVAKQTAETQAEVAEEVAKSTARVRVGREMAARDVAKRYAARNAEAGEGDAEIRATIDEMRAEMREIRKLMQQIRERSQDEAPKEVSVLPSAGLGELRLLQEGNLLAPARLKEAFELQQLEPGQHRVHVLTPDSRPAHAVEVEGKPIELVEGHAVHTMEGTRVRIVEGQPAEVEVEGKPVIVRRVRGTAASSPSTTSGGR